MEPGNLHLLVSYARTCQRPELVFLTICSSLTQPGDRYSTPRQLNRKGGAPLSQLSFF